MSRFLIIIKMIEQFKKVLLSLITLKVNEELKLFKYLNRYRAERETQELIIFKDLVLFLHFFTLLTSYNFEKHFNLNYSTDEHLKLLVNLVNQIFKVLSPY